MDIDSYKKLLARLSLESVPVFGSRFKYPCTPGTWAWRLPGDFDYHVVLRQSVHCPDRFDLWRVPLCEPGARQWVCRVHPEWTPTKAHDLMFCANKMRWSHE